MEVLFVNIFSLLVGYLFASLMISIAVQNGTLVFFKHKGFWK